MVVWVYKIARFNDSAQLVGKIIEIIKYKI